MNIVASRPPKLDYKWTTMQTCSNCNALSPDSALTCSECGSDLGELSDRSVSRARLQENPRVKYVRIIVSHDACPACRRPTTEVADVVDAALEQAVTQEAELELVRSNEARKRLPVGEPIGAILRF